MSFMTNRRVGKTAAPPLLVSLLALALALGARDGRAAEPTPEAEEAGLRPTDPKAGGRDQRVVQLNDEGSALYAAGDYRRAAELFLQAYAVDEDPNLLFNVASCYEGLGDLEAAIEKYQAFLDSPDADAVGRPRAERAIERLEGEIAAAQAPAPPPPPAAAPPPAVAAAPAPADTSDAGLPGWAPWVGLGGGAALSALGATFYLLGAADHAKVTDARGYGDPRAVLAMTRTEADDLVHSGDVKKQIGVGALAAGGALVAGYVAWWLLDGSADDTAGGASTEPRVDVALGSSAARVLVSGSY